MSLCDGVVDCILAYVPFRRFQEMDPSISGRGAEPVYRDKKGLVKLACFSPFFLYAYDPYLLISF